MLLYFRSLKHRDGSELNRPYVSQCTLSFYPLLLCHRIAEEAEFFAQTPVLAVRKTYEVCLFQDQLAFFVEQRLIRIDGHYLSYKQIVASQLHYVPYHTFQ